MYEEFYGLTASPFRLTPDIRFFFNAATHERALSYLRYGLHQREGFVVISGESGVGKSTLINILLQDLVKESDILVATLMTSQLDPQDALYMLLKSFGIEEELYSKSEMLVAFEKFLRLQHQRGRRILVIVDEAHNLPYQTLEELRMLSNLSEEGQALFQCFLLGQAEFLTTLERPDMRQLKQRVIALCRLLPLTQQEVKEYVTYRLECAGWQGHPHWSDEIFPLIHQYSAGLPRRINSLCSRLLIHGSLEKLDVLDRQAIEFVIAEQASEGEESLDQQLVALENVQDFQPEAQDMASGMEEAMNDEWDEKIDTDVKSAVLAEKAPIEQSDTLSVVAQPIHDEWDKKGVENLILSENMAHEFDADEPMIQGNMISEDTDNEQIDQVLGQLTDVSQRLIEQFPDLVEKQDEQSAMDKDLPLDPYQRMEKNFAHLETVLAEREDIVRRLIDVSMTVLDADSESVYRRSGSDDSVR